MNKPFYHLVPKEFNANLRWRKAVLELCRSDEEARREIWMMCARDLLFYINTFVWTYDPRKRDHTGKVIGAIPFITWKFQDDGLEIMEDCLSKGEDMVIEKSRDMGASWLTLLLFEWHWHFHDRTTFLLVSWKEEMVDSKEDMDALLPRIDFTHAHQPGWLLPSTVRTDMKLYNQHNGSLISGSSTTGNVGRGGRRTGMLLDEFATVENQSEVKTATADVTNCRIYNSTPKGAHNAFYDLTHGGCKNKLRFHWSSHPEKAVGLYYDDKGKPRSPWYDKECERRGSLQEIAQELDIDYLGSDYQFFDAAILDRVQAVFCTPFYAEGELEFDETYQKVVFVERENGPLRLWFKPVDGEVPPDDYVCGIDIAAGSGASNSCASVVSKSKGEKVAEYANPRISPEDFARFCVALCRWFKDAFMIWEANGPGQPFGRKIQTIRYVNIFFRRDEKSIALKISDTPGWWTTLDSKRTLLSEYRDALKEMKFVNRSKMAIQEAREYVYTENWVEHNSYTDRRDPSGAGANHGDRVIADALAWRAMRDSLLLNIRAQDEASSIKAGSFAWRRERRHAEAVTERYW